MFGGIRECTGFTSKFYQVTVILGILLVNYGNSYRIRDNPYHRAALLDNRDRYRVEWMVTNDRITFNLTVQSRGWVLFGLANDGDERTGRDVVIGGVGQDGQPYFSDRHTGRYNERLQEDVNQDYTLESSWETATHTFLSFSRDLDTCDHQDYPITENRVTLIWAYGNEDNPNGEEGGRGRVNGGTYDIYLMDPEFSPRVIRANLYDQVPRVSGRESATTQVWTITQNTRIPRNDTAYLCSIHKAPRLSRKHHMIGFDVKFADEISRLHTHHMIVHKCRAPRGSSTRSIFETLSQNGAQQSCLSVARPGTESIPTHLCQQVYMVWALGGREFFTPDHIGFPFGDDPDEYYMLQVHYDNPDMRSDVTVSFNVDFFYTRRLRPNEGGFMVFGHEVPGLPESTLIPPQTQYDRRFGHCSGECTSRMLPREGITLVAGFLHSHVSGRQLRLHHFRRNEELRWILYDDNYSNDFQQVRALPRGEVQVLPGDQVTMDCTYDNTWTNGSVIGGYRTRNEMCLAYVVYYNLVPDYTYCRSEIVSPSYRQQFLGVTNITFLESRLDWVAMPPSPRHLVGRTLTEISDSLNWDAESRRELLQVHEQHTHTGKCGRDFHARDPAEIQQFIEMVESQQDSAGEQGLVIEGDVATNVDTENDYAGPVQYPGDIIPYSIPESTCLHRGIFTNRNI